MLSNEIWEISQERYLKQIMALEGASMWVIEDEWDGVLFEAEESKDNIWLWFILRFPSSTTSGNEGGLHWNFWRHKNHLDFFKEANHIISELHTGILATICPHGRAFKPTALSCHWISSSSWVTQERGRNLFVNSLHYSGQNMVPIQHRQCQLTLRCCGFCSGWLCALLSLSITEGTLDLPQAHRLAFHRMWLCFLFFGH